MVVDISNPRPDTVFWTFPGTVTVVDNNPFAPVIVSSDTGAVIIGMETHVGSCTMSLSKTVHFIFKRILWQHRQRERIELVTVYPTEHRAVFSR